MHDNGSPLPLAKEILRKQSPFPFNKVSFAGLSLSVGRFCEQHSNSSYCEVTQVDRPKKRIGAHRLPNQAIRANSVEHGVVSLYQFYLAYASPPAK
jgi:hypothetical protein